LSPSGISVRSWTDPEMLAAIALLLFAAACPWFPTWSSKFRRRLH
jgi:hypothetical protein